MPTSPKGYLPFRLPVQNFVCTSHLQYMCYKHAHLILLTTVNFITFITLKSLSVCSIKCSYGITADVDPTTKHKADMRLQSANRDNPDMTSLPFTANGNKGAEYTLQN